MGRVHAAHVDLTHAAPNGDEHFPRSSVQINSMKHIAPWPTEQPKGGWPTSPREVLLQSDRNQIPAGTADRSERLDAAAGRTWSRPGLGAAPLGVVDSSLD